MSLAFVNGWLLLLEWQRRADCARAARWTTHNRDRKRGVDRRRCRNNRVISRWMVWQWMQGHQADVRAWRKSETAAQRVVLQARRERDNRAARAGAARAKQENPEVYAARRRVSRRKAKKKGWLLESLRERVRQVLVGVAKKSEPTRQLLGCSLPYFRAHIERQFKPGMTWGHKG